MPEIASQAGFSLIEMVMAITIIGILSAITVGFLRMPLQTYQDITRRTALTETADFALRRITRDVQGALPNSVRVSGPGGGACIYDGVTPCYLEFIPIVTGGRYRKQSGGGAAVCPVAPGLTDALDFDANDTCFATLGSIPNPGAVNARQFLVVANFGPGIANADAYAAIEPGNNRALNVAITAGSQGTNEDQITFAAHNFSLTSPNSSFQIVDTPVTYACNPVTRTLTLMAGYGFSSAQGTPPAGATTTALLANNVTRCLFVFNTSAVTQRNNFVLMTLELTESDAGGGNSESIQLLMQARVSN